VIMDLDDTELRLRLDEVSHALRPLHKALVDLVQADYEKRQGRPVGGPVQLFQLLTRDPFFLWLHPMSALMAEIDELYDQKEPVAMDAVAVRRYYSGRAEVKGFDIADKAVVGDVAGAAEALRWAMMSGEPHVVLADALAEAVHTIARVGPLSGDHYRLASELGMPPWRVQKAQKQARRWSRGSIAEAMRLVATLNADVKGAAADADYALEAAVRKVAELAAD